MSTLRILHISDFHARAERERDAWRRRRVLGEAWDRNLDDLLDDGRDVDLVAFTGDIADWGRAEEYAEVTSFLDALLERLKLGRERLFLVPGNHDIHRPTREDVWKTLRRDLPRTPAKERSAWMAGGYAPLGIENDHRDAILERQGAYRSWLEHGLGLGALLPNRSPHGRLGYRATLRLPGRPFDVHVIGLDSAWLCGGDDDPKKLLLTEDQVGRLATDGGRSLSGFRLALIHHPLSDLADERSVRDLLAEHTDLLLRGHLHEPDVLTHSDTDQTLRMLAAGCLYEGDLGNAWPNACHLIDVTLDAAGRPERYDLRLRGYSDRGKGFWYDDGSLSPKAPAGRYRWEISAPAPLQTPPQNERRFDTFVGREAELEELRGALLPSDGAPRPVGIVALHGMAGVGKSFLAERFTALHKADFPGGVVRLALEPEENRSIEALLSEIAAMRRLPAGGPDVAQQLRAHLLSPRALVHIDNADAKEAAAAAAGLVNVLHGCAVVVTGRFAGLGQSAGWAQVTVEPLDTQTALLQLVKEHRPPGADERQAYVRLVEKLGGLPLAVSLAAAYLRDGQTPDGFAELLSEKMLALEPPDPARVVLAGGPSRVILAASFELSLNLLEHHLGEDAVPLLAGFFALGHAPAAGFGRSLGAAVSGLSEARFGQLVAAATRLSVLHRVAGPKDRWALHPLLAEFVRPRASSETVLTRMTEWFVERLPELPPGQEKLQGERWEEIHTEVATLVALLPRVPKDALARVERAGSKYAMRCGPFPAWMQLCQRVVDELKEAKARSDVLWTLAHVAFRAGNLDRALDAAETKAALDRERGDEREVALAMAMRADIFQFRGQPDEALRIRQHEVLPIFEKLGDVRSRAFVMGKIADIFQDRGQLDEALRIRQHEELPVFEKLDDIRLRAFTMSKIASIFRIQGQLDEALRIRQHEELPIYEKLGDVRARAVALGKVADIFQTQGRLDDALRIRQQEELPVYEKLGDIRERAVTMGKIASVFQARGQLDEALRIRQHEELPVFEKLGSVRDTLVARTNIAMLHLQRSAPGDREAAAELLRLALKAAEDLRIPEADQIRQILHKHGLPPA
ncbi:MAG TPA: metallophosphoesterase [Polyangiaceae bacterium]|nr:metallophosphoesterase [Polyangiaceae bacterium]